MRENGSANGGGGVGGRYWGMPCAAGPGPAVSDLALWPCQSTWILRPQNRHSERAGLGNASVAHYDPSMDQAWAAVVGAAIGSIGATGAAVVAGWSGGRQASIQASSQKDQWRRQIRRDAYGALLRAGAEARDELGSLWSLLRDTDRTRSPRWFTSRLDEIKPLVNAVRLATAVVFVEGPAPILDPARRVEEGIVLFHTAMLGVIKDLPGSAGKSTALYMAMCSEQRVSVRNSLIDFASVARMVIDGDATDSVIAPPALSAASDSARELSWLIAGIALVLNVPETQIDPDGTFADHELDSLTIVRLISILGQHGLHCEISWLYEHWQLSLHEIASALSSMRTAGADPKQLFGTPEHRQRRKIRRRH